MEPKLAATCTGEQLLRATIRKKVLALLPFPMARHLKPQSAQRFIAEELEAKAAEIRRRYGPDIGWEELQALLSDRDIIPFPCELRFDASPLLPGEFGHPVAKGNSREQGFVIYIHPLFSSQLGRVPYLVLHQLVLVSHGETATLYDAETFGALALGLSKDAYYRALCDLSWQVGGDDLL